MTGSLTGATFAPRDVFWGQLAGCLEMIDAGTTTVLDHSNINYSPAHCQYHTRDAHPAEVTTNLLPV